ncbi:MAG: sulfite exporter TauE/SafE family protein [Rhodospirillales bacterium]|nr:sulfite exporter TauE/SafE family protein [Rhodospirillales bacterium]
MSYLLEILSAVGVSGAGAVVISLAFLAAGTVKGVLGIGLPLVAVPLIATVTEPAMAIALMTVPALISNGWQALQGGHQGIVVRRFWPVIIAVIVGTLIGAGVLVGVDPKIIARLLGGIVLAFVVSRFFPSPMSISAGAERTMGIGMGFAAGILGGVSNFYAPLLAMYLVALRVSKDLFVAAIALFFFCGMLTLYVSLAINGVLGWPELSASTLTVFPLVIGLVFGRSLRKRVSQKIFEWALLAVLSVIGIGLIARTL